MGFPRPFCLAPPAWIATALELLRLAQVDRCGVYVVADGEWCVAMSAGSSRVFRWLERARRAWWRARRRARPVLRSVLRPLTAPPLPIA